jgi:geranylgeranyl reductase family protein
MAARTLATAGHDVVVLEEHETIGIPVHCTGLLGMQAFEELGLSRSSILATAHAARFFAADRSSVLVEAENVRAAVVDRAAFDQALAVEAGAAGAELRAGVRVGSIEVVDDRVVVGGDAASSRVEARCCVLACGASYRFNRALGLGVPKAYVQTAQVEVELEGPAGVEVYLGRDVAPGGFAWVVPFARGERRHARVGLMCDSSAFPRFAEFADRVKQQHPGGDVLWPRPRLKMLPLAPVSRTYGTRLLAVGDAAGLVKPTTGGGIYYSLLSGRLAGDVLDSALAADDLREARLRGYEARWRDRLGTEIRVGLAFRSLVSRLTDPAIDALVELARIDGLIPLLKQTADFNWHGASALALLRHNQFRRILLGSLWS